MLKNELPGCCVQENCISLQFCSSSRSTSRISSLGKEKTGAGHALVQGQGWVHPLNQNSNWHPSCPNYASCCSQAKIKVCQRMMPLENSAPPWESQKWDSQKWDFLSVIPMDMSLQIAGSSPTNNCAQGEDGGGCR